MRYPAAVPSNRRSRSRLTVHARARKVRLLVLDVDGVLTDGRITLDSHGNQIKSFYVRDGFGLVLARHAGLKTAFLTAERSGAVAFRAKQLKIDWVAQGALDKGPAFQRCLAYFRLSPEAVGFIGDDLLDLPVLTRVGFSATVSDAPEEVKRHVHYVTTASGGRGAVRELVELILNSQGRWDRLVQRYLELM